MGAGQDCLPLGCDLRRPALVSSAVDTLRGLCLLSLKSKLGPSAEHRPAFPLPPRHCEMLVLTGGSFKLINMPGQLGNALPPPSFLSLGFSLEMKLSNLVGLGFLQPEAAALSGGLHTSSAVPLTSVPGYTCLKTTWIFWSICGVGFDIHTFVGWEEGAVGE